MMKDEWGRKNTAKTQAARRAGRLVSSTDCPLRIFKWLLTADRQPLTVYAIPQR
jgi:hypothetical protein